MSARELPSIRTALRMELACDFGRVRGVAEQVLDFLKNHGCDDESRSDCELALVEACNNAIKYAGPSGCRFPVMLDVTVEASAVEMRITDHGPGFDWPETASLPDAESESGRGLYLIRALMDSAEYIRGDHENTLVLRKKCFAAPLHGCGIVSG